MDNKRQPKTVETKEYDRKEAQNDLNKLASKIGDNYCSAQKTVRFSNATEYTTTYTAYIDGVGHTSADSWRKAVNLMSKKVREKLFKK